MRYMPMTSSAAEIADSDLTARYLSLTEALPILSDALTRTMPPSNGTGNIRFNAGDERVRKLKSGTGTDDGCLYRLERKLCVDDTAEM
jgi:hypothetical protein